MTTKTTHPPKIKLSDYPDEVRADKWINVYFQTDGVVFYGVNHYPTEESAKQRFDEYCRKKLSALKSGIISESKILDYLPDGAVLFRFTKFSHGIQLPIKS